MTVVPLVGETMVALWANAESARGARRRNLFNMLMV